MLDEDHRPDRSGEILAGRYQLLAAIGIGSQATVYRARSLRSRELYAVKILASTLSTSSDARFDLEGALLYRIAHPNVVRVLESGEDAGERYLVMELCEGSLDDLLNRDGAQSFAVARHWTLQLLQALGAAHAKGVVHRDIKPSNLLVGSDGRLKVCDFGIARADLGPKLTRTGTGFGTPAYMAPEQRHDAANVGPAADLYAAGATFYHLLTGVLPPDMWWQEAKVEALAGLPVNVAAFIAKATEFDPTDRFASAKDMRAALETLDPNAQSLDPQYNPVRRRPIAPQLVAGVLLLAMVGGAGLGWALSTVQRRALHPPESGTPVVLAPHTAALRPAPPAVTERVQVTVRGGRAAVRIDGTLAGWTPFDDTLPVGEHELVLVGEDGRTFLRPLRLEAGTPFEYCHDLKAAAPCGR
jgi:serine/threonine protein kinase